MKPRMASALIGLRLAVRGLWYRRSTALIVLVLAVVASAAAVVAPLYSRAAEESIVRDTLQRADVYSLGVHISRPQGDRKDPVEDEQKAPFAAAQMPGSLTRSLASSSPANTSYASSTTRTARGFCQRLSRFSSSRNKSALQIGCSADL